MHIYEDSDLDADECAVGSNGCFVVIASAVIAWAIIAFLWFLI
jgi:hypothetical protein